MKKRLAVIALAVAGLIGASSGTALGSFFNPNPSPEGSHGSGCLGFGTPEIACVAPPFDGG